MGHKHFKKYAIKRSPNINEIYEVKKKLENEIPNFVSTELEWLPLNLVSLNGDNKDNMIKFLEALDDEDDVQNIFTNANLKNLQ